MPNSRKADYSRRAFAVPMGLILGLLVTYWLISDWHALPGMIHSAMSSF